MVASVDSVVVVDSVGTAAMEAVATEAAATEVAAMEAAASAVG